MPNYLDKHPPILKEYPGKKLCVCMGAKEVKKQTDATMSSGSCIQQNKQLIVCLCAPEPVKRRDRRKKINK